MLTKKSTKICYLGYRSTERKDCTIFCRFWQRKPSFLGSSGNQAMPKWVTIFFFPFFFLFFESPFIMTRKSSATKRMTLGAKWFFPPQARGLGPPLFRRGAVVRPLWEPHPHLWVHLRAGKSSFLCSLAQWSNERRKWEKLQRFSKPSLLSWHLSWNLHFGASVW